MLRCFARPQPHPVLVGAEIRQTSRSHNGAEKAKQKEECFQQTFI